MSTQPATIETDDGYTITSSSETAKDMAETHAQPEGEGDEKKAPKLSDAAATLGKAGGKAAAEKRAAQPKEKAEPDPEPEPAAAKAPEDDDAADIQKPGIRKRIEAKAREAAEARAERDRERQERLRLAEENERLRQAASPQRQDPSGQRQEASANRQVPDDDPKPLLADFEEHEDFVEARARWAARQEFKEQYEARRREAAARYRETQVVSTIGSYVDKHLERVAGGSKADPGWKDRYYEFLDAQSPEVQALKPTFDIKPGERYTRSHDIADCLVKAEHPRELMQHLSANPQDLQRIAALGSRDDVLVAMAKLEARFDGATAGTRVEPRVSKANPPLRPVSGSPHTAADELDDDTSYDDHVRIMNAKERRAR